MKRYLVLYRAPETAKAQMHNASPEQMKSVKDAWASWAKKAGSAIVDIGAPTAESQKYTSAKSAQDGDPSIGGFSIFQAESKDALSKVLDGHPHFSMAGSAIEVHEIIAM
jgi:hypothetical protein